MDSRKDVVLRILTTFQNPKNASLLALETSRISGVRAND